MFNNKDDSTDLGKIKIHKNVIASIASLAASDIDGVKRIGNNLKSGLMELLGKKSYSSIRVEFDKNNDVIVEVPLIIKYGFNIPEVSSKAQENIRINLEKMTNLTVKEVNVRVMAIERG